MQYYNDRADEILIKLETQNNSSDLLDEYVCFWIIESVFIEDRNKLTQKRAFVDKISIGIARDEISNKTKEARELLSSINKGIYSERANYIDDSYDFCILTATCMSLQNYSII